MGELLQLRTAPPLSRGAEIDDTPALAIRGPRRVGLVVIGLFFGIGGALAATAPLASAIVSPGEVSPEGRRRAVQSLDGGVLSEVKVHEGQSVRLGQVLATLEDLRSRAEYRAALRTVRQLAAQDARLLAERTGRPSIAFSHPSLADAADPEVAETRRAEQALFEARRSNGRSREDVLRQRISQYEIQIAAAKGRIESIDAQIKLLDEEIDVVGGLVQKGFASKPRWLELRRRRSDLTGQTRELEGSIAQAREAIGGVRIELISLGADRLEEAGSQAGDIATRLAAAERALSTALDQVRKTELRASVDGAVIGLKHSSAGSVIGPGETLMEIVPSASMLTVRAQIRPSDVDLVKVSQRARVVFSGIARGQSASFYGRVVELSPDAEVDAKGRGSFYSALVLLDRRQVEARLAGVKVMAGMPAQVYFEGRTRTVLSYISEPLTRIMENGMREE